MAVPSKEELERAQEIVETIKEQNKEYKRLGVLNRSHVDSLKAAQDALKEIIKLRDQESATFREQVQFSEKYYQTIKDIGKSLDNGLLKNQALAQIERDKIALIEDQIRQGTITQAQAQKEIQASSKILDNFKAKEQRINNIRAQIQKTSIVNSKFVQSTIQLGTAFREGGITTGFQYISSLLMGPILSGVNLVVGSFKKLFFELDATTSQFMTATGMNREFTMSLEGTARQLQRDAGTTLPEYYAATEQLITSVTDFTMASAAQQKTMAQTATMLERQGVALQDFGAGAQNSMKMFGMSMNEASSFASELTQTAKALGVTPKQMASDFAQVGGSLAKLGSQGPKAFKELARTSKLTGMEITKLINLTSKFDTFEDAATMTGQLNAALGGNFVNAMDMMTTTDPVQRFEMLRDAISSTGLTFDEMSYYQRQFFANAMGLESVGDLALMMSGNMNMMAGATQETAADYEKMAREAEATADLQRLFNSVLAEMAPIMGEVLLAVRDFMTDLSQNKTLLADIRSAFDTVGGAIKLVIDNIDLLTKLYIGLAIAGPILTILSGAMKILASSTTIASMSSVKLTADKIAETAALQASGVALDKNNASMGRSGPVAGGAAGGLMKFALAVLAIGAGIGIAAAGIGLMAMGLKELFLVAPPAELAAFAGALALVGLAGITLTVGVAGWFAFAVALGGVAAAMALISADKLNSLATFTTALAEMDNSNLTELANTLERVAEAMSEIGTAKAIALTATMTAATAAAKAVAGGTVRDDGGRRESGGFFRGNRQSGGDIGTLKIEFNNDMFKSKVFKLVDESEKIKAIEAELDQR